MRSTWHIWAYVRFCTTGRNKVNYLQLSVGLTNGINAYSNGNGERSIEAHKPKTVSLGLGFWFHLICFHWNEYKRVNKHVMWGKLCENMAMGNAYPDSNPMECKRRAPKTLHSENPPFFHTSTSAVPSGVHFSSDTAPQICSASGGYNLEKWATTRVSDEAFSNHSPGNSLLETTSLCETMSAPVNSSKW